MTKKLLGQLLRNAPDFELVSHKLTNKIIGIFFLPWVLCLILACRQGPKTVHAEPSVPPTLPSDQYGQPIVVGRLKNPSIDESSGLVASRTMPGVFWTHNDSGGGPYVYAFDLNGDSVGVWRVSGVDPDDWEDVSIGPGPQAGITYLYIGDIGDNDSARREIVVYRVVEPKAGPEDRKSSKSKPLLTESAEAIRLRYPDGKHDAEALIVHPVSGNIYIVTKVALQSAGIYEAAPPFDTSRPITMNRIGELKPTSVFGGIITGGSVSPDGTRIALCDYFQAFEATLPPNSHNFDDIWKQPLRSLNFGKRNQGEAIAYRLDGRALLGTSEGRGAQVIEVERK
jgi:hypothetical protein